MTKEIIINDSLIAYSIYGAGKPVFLIHGFGESSNVWQDQIDFLEKDFAIIVPDLPGSGLSEKLTDTSMESMAEVIKAIADKESINSFVLIGHSMGGYISLAYAAKYAGSLKGLGLFHSSAYADSEEKKNTRKKGIEFIKKNGAASFLQTTSPNLFAPVTVEKNGALVDNFIASLPAFTEDSLVDYYEAMMARPDRTSVLRNSKIPILFVIGEHDNAVPKNDMLEQSHMPEKAYIHILHQSGHMGMLEETKKANTLLKEFISNC